MNLNWTAIVAAVVTLGSMISIASGHAALGAIFSDPNTATELTAVIGGLTGLVSAFSGAVHKPVTK